MDGVAVAALESALDNVSDADVGIAAAPASVPEAAEATDLPAPADVPASAELPSPAPAASPAAEEAEVVPPAEEAKAVEPEVVPANVNNI